VTANGGERAIVSVGQPVSLSATVETPPDTGKIVAAEWDFDGTGTFAVPQVIHKVDSTDSGAQMTFTVNHSFSKPGTYFATLRVTSQRDGDEHTPYGRIHNLGRVRVVVK
jgi:hypothetical protein